MYVLLAVIEELPAGKFNLKKKKESLKKKKKKHIYSDVHTKYPHM